MQKFSKQQKKEFDEIFGNRELEGKIEKEFYKKTYKYLKFIKWLPGLKMVGIGNSISSNSATKNSDIDLFIVSSPNSMWFVRIFVTFIFAILGVRKTPKKHAGRFCLSFFATTSGLDFSKFALDNDPYLYFWIAYFKPLLDYDNTYDLFLEKNKTWADFGEYEKDFEKNRKYIKYCRDVSLDTSECKNNMFNINKMFQRNISTFLDKIIKKIFLPKTLKHYEKIGKPFGVIINDDLLKFHNGDIRKEIANIIK